jgi:small-conductance mechanosensitive channel
MEKIKESVEINYLPVKIFLDEIKEIVFLFKEANIPFIITTDLYEYDNYEELYSNEKSVTVKYLTIRSNKFNYISITFGQYGAFLRMTKENLEAEGVYSKINKLIKKRQRPFAFIYSLYFIVFVVNPLLFVIPMYLGLSHVITAYASLILCTIAISLIICLCYIRLKRGAIVELIERKERSNFFKRKKDEIFLAIISAILGGAVTYILTIYFLSIKRG